MHYVRMPSPSPLLTSAVRNGDLVQFNRTVESYGEQFQREKTYSLIVRLRHNVIKTGIRMISLSYSRYSLSLSLLPLLSHTLSLPLSHTLSVSHMVISDYYTPFLQDFSG